MSLITSCPVCGTMFRVVPDQLKISEGWVRCGHCNEVFDASAHLIDEEAPAGAVAESVAGRPEAQPAEADSDWEPTGAAPLSMPAPLAPAAEAPPPSPPAREGAELPSPTLRRAAALDETPIPVSRFGPDSQSLESSALDTPFVFRRSDFVEPDPMPSVLPPVPSAGDSRFEYEEEGAEPELPQVSFVRHARRKDFWRRPMVRLALTFFSLALAAALVLQVAYRDRDRLAATQPQLRPALEQMCDFLQCSLRPPRQIDAIVIESSGFNRLRGDNYRLSFNVRNTSPLRVAAPALELTLTDAQDQALLRRVLTPAELGAADSIGPNAEWSGTPGVVVSAGNATRVAGYRLLAFYP